MKKFIRITLFLFILIFSSFLVSANTYYDQWGFSNHREAGDTINDLQDRYYKGVLWGSNFESNTTISDFSKKAVGVASNYTPLVMDINQDGKLEIIVVAGNTFRIFSNSGSQLASYTGTNSFCGKPGIVAKYTYITNDPYSRQIYFMTNHSINHYQILGFNYTSDKGLVLDSTSVEFTDKNNICNLMGGTSFLGFYSTDAGFWPKLGSVIKYGFDAFTKIFSPTTPPVIYIYPTTEINASYYLISPYTDNSVMLYNAITNTITTNSQTPPYATTALNSKITLGSGSSCGQAQINGVQTNLCAWISKDSGSKIPNITMWDMYADAYYTKALTTAGTYDYSTVAFANIGDPTGDPELIVTLGTGIGNVAILQVYDVGLNKLKEISGTTGWSMPMVCNFDRSSDASNELVVCEDNKLYAYDSLSYNSSYQGNFSGSRCKEFSACGNFVKNASNGFAQILAYDGIYAYNGFFQPMQNIYNMGITGTEMGQYLPLSLEPKTTYSNDILFVSQTELIYYTASGVVTSNCGNGVCELGESIFSCSADCFINPFGNGSIDNQSIGYLPKDSHCESDDWCISGVCDDLTKKCTSLEGGTLCTSNSQCLSNICDARGYCTDADSVDLTESFFGAIFGTSLKAKLLTGFFLCLFCALLIGLFSIYATGSFMAGLLGSVVGGFFGLIVGTFVFSFIPIWFIVLIIIIILTLALMMIYLSGAS